MKRYFTRAPWQSTARLFLAGHAPLRLDAFCARSRRISLLGSSSSLDCCSDLSGATALTHLYRLWAETPKRAATSGTEDPRSMTCLTASSLNSGVTSGCSWHSLLCSKDRRSLSIGPGAVQSLKPAAAQPLVLYSEARVNRSASLGFPQDSPTPKAVVANRPGASSAVGARYVAQAKTCPNWRSCRTKGPTA